MLFNSKHVLLCITLMLPSYQSAMENGASLQNQNKWFQSINFIGLKHLGIRGGSRSDSLMSFSPDSKSLITAGGDPVGIVWNLAAGKNMSFGKAILSSHNWHGVHRYYDRSQLIDSHSCDSSPQYSPDGMYIVYANGSYIMIYNVATNKLGVFNSNNFHSHADVITSVQFSNCGKYILSASNDSTIKIWDIVTGGCLKTIFANNALFFANFSADDKFIVAGSELGSDIIIKIFDVSNGSCVKTFRENNYMGRALYSSKGNYLVFNQDKQIKVWDMQDNIRTLGDANDSAVSFFVASPDGRFLATSHPSKRSCKSATIKIWDMKKFSCVQTIEYHPDLSVVGACFSPDSKLLAMAYYENSSIIIWENQSIVTSHESLSGQKNPIVQQHFQQQLIPHISAMCSQGILQKINQESQKGTCKCTVCTSEKTAADFYKLSCGHEFCVNCLNTIVDKDAKERLCPDQSCKQPIKRADVTKIGYTYLLSKTTKALAKTTKVLNSLNE